MIATAGHLLFFLCLPWTSGSVRSGIMELSVRHANAVPKFYVLISRLRYGTPVYTHKLLALTLTAQRPDRRHHSNAHNTQP
jgi:hypothetical protein